MKLLSEASEYALRAVVWCARYPDRTFKVREIAESTRAAPGYLAKVLQSLAKADILHAQRGSRGGFRLNRDPATLTALEVIQAVDPIERIQSCPLESNETGMLLCPLHKRIDEVVNALEKAFADTTIKDLIQQTTTPSAEKSCKRLCSHHVDQDKQ